MYVLQLLFETSLEASRKDDIRDWELCDIDGWLEGNEFWVQEKNKTSTSGGSK
jgi:hypothetical protein